MRRRWRLGRAARCEQCGGALPADATVCPACGAAVAPESDTYRCRGCGARVALAEQTCPICGRERDSQRLTLPWRPVLTLLALVAALYGGYSVWPRLQQVDESQVALGPSPTATNSPYPSWTPSGTPSPTATPSITPTPPPSATPTPGSSATPTLAPTVTPVVETYVVVWGDSPNSVATRFGMDVETLMSMNQLRRWDTFVVDQELVVIDMRTPTPTLAPDEIDALADTATPTATETATATATPGLLVHVVQAGDMLGSLAVQYDVDTSSIAAANGIDTTAILHIGQELVIPGMTATPSATPSPTQTATPTRAATPLPTIPPRPTSVPMEYNSPQLLGPRDGSDLVGGDVILNWASVGILDDVEWYEVALSRPCDATPMRHWTRATSWRLTAGELCQDPDSGAYTWSLRIVLKSGTLTEELSLLSRTRSFTWRP